MRVTFDPNPPKVHMLYCWSYAYRTARCGDWMQYARDRARFQRRISATEKVLESMLKRKISEMNS